MKKGLFAILMGLAVLVFGAKYGHAQEVNDIAENIVDSASLLPAILAGFAYLSGLIMCVTGIFKTVDHVSNPTQTPMRVPVIRFLIGGGLFSIPIITTAAYNTITGGTAVDFNTSADIISILSSVFSTTTGFMTLGTNFNTLLDNIVDSTDLIPGLISAIAYSLGLIITVSALYKTRDHVEEPNRVPLKDVVIRYLTAGALFGLPTVYEAMYQTISAGGMGVGGTLFSLLSTWSFFQSTETPVLSVDCSAVVVSLGYGVGDVICNSVLNTTGFPTFLAAVAYVIGLVFGVWGILKVRDHVNEPSKVPLSAGISRLIAGGMFFSLPYVTVILKSTFLDAWLAGISSIVTNTGHTSDTTLVCGTTNSLDEAMSCFMADIRGPAHIALNFFCYVAGMILIMIGISRLIKSSQEGPKGPGGIGTFGTFVVGGVLLSATTILRAFSSSMFGNPITYTYASLQYTTGMSSAETEAATNVISAVLQFLAVIGMISFVRGLFIMRDVSEGKGQASVMAGMTHMIGGALAVNLGPLLNAVQQTLGVTAFGVSFS